MKLLITRQKTNPDTRMRTNGDKPRLMHGVNPKTEGIYCGVELSNPYEFEGTWADVTCIRCVVNAGKRAGIHEL